MAGEQEEDLPDGSGHGQTKERDAERPPPCGTMAVRLGKKDQTPELVVLSTWRWQICGSESWKAASNRGNRCQALVEQSGQGRT